MIRLIVSDIDGTLVGDGQGEGSLNPEYYQVIHRLSEKGVRFMACSGRQRLSIAKLFRPIENEIYYACDGGSLVFDRDVLLFARTLPKEMAYDIIRDAREIPPCDVMVCGTKRAYCRSEDSELYRWMVNGYGYDIQAVGNLTENIEDDIVKVSVYHHDRAEELTNPWFRPKWEEKVKLTLAGIQWLDCVPKDAGKGSALTFMQEHFQISPSETLVFGDNQNDMEMFERAEESYAVENAREEVKQAAAHICPGYSEDGVLQILQKVLKKM
ncbi:MAG: HAD family hydrolase [Lachnospiraceae bacterium]|nr:HAD family hydrolase [Lachnospiraceae bacterium]